ncbi:MAG: Phosphatidylglycerophosphatase A [Legionellaceae bacterium]
MYIAPRSIWQKPLHFIAFGFGSGAMPYMPGTFGTLMAIPFYLMLQKLPFYGYLSIVTFATLFGIWMCDKVSKELNESDPPGMVWDEIAGFGITMIGAPHSGYSILIGFILFRFFDILKPGPIGWIDRNVKGGLGIMLDDIVAGICACICLHLFIKLIPV